MIFYKKISLALCLIGLFAVSLAAQQNVERTLQDIQKGNYGTPEQRTVDLTKKMQEGLQLTPEQTVKVQAINLRYAQRTEREVVQQKMSDWSKYRKISTIQSEKDTELQQILTAEQFKKYQKKRDDAMWQAVKSFFF